ncbi:MAG TPA: homoserine O-succinyltransferase [Methylocystis sp.]|nr:homoserine O-succinyltransferase [Methylocystis sp.]
MSLAPLHYPHGDAPIEVALVNNMPDQAIEATIAQFASLLHAGARGLNYSLRLYSLPSALRSETARRLIAQTHEPIDKLYARGADALLVTGAEPQARQLTREPYWDEFAQLVAWARLNTYGALWSCLAAHGAVLALDGIERRREEHKISGVFACETSANDWAVQGARRVIQTPHSRYNGLAPEDLEQSGYHISSFSDEIGVDNFWRREPSLFLFMQGHPEYDADTLLREFRRDTLRYINEETAIFPPTPENYFSGVAESGIADLRKTADTTRRMRFLERMSALLEAEAPQAVWREHAERLYRNFLSQIAFEKAMRSRSLAI